MRRKCRRKGRGIVRDRGDVVQETEEGQCKRQDSCSARVRREAVLETGEWQCRKMGMGSPEK